MRKSLIALFVVVALTFSVAGCGSSSISDWLTKATGYSQLVSYNMAEKGWTVPGDPIGFSNYCYDLVQSIRDAASSSGDVATVTAIDKASNKNKRELAEAFNVGGDW